MQVINLPKINNNDIYYFSCDEWKNTMKVGNGNNRKQFIRWVKFIFNIFFRII